MNLIIKFSLSIFISLFCILNTYSANTTCGNVNKSKSIYYLDELSGNSSITVKSIDYNGFNVVINQDNGLYILERYIDGNNFGVKVNGKIVLTLNFDDYDNNLSAFISPILSNVTYDSYLNKPKCPSGYLNVAISNNTYVCRKSENLQFNVPCVDIIPELTGNLSFINNDTGTPIDITDISILGSPVSNGVYGELTSNNFINKSVYVRLVCNSSSCEPGTSNGILMNENGTGELSITDKLGRKLTKKFQVWKINKTKPIGNILYLNSNDTWSNSQKVVKLNGTATVFGSETFNSDWLIGNPNPSFVCDVEGGCIGNLEIEDSAGNKLKLPYDIKKIDLTNPNIIIKDYAELNSEGKKKIGVTCTDNGGSGCQIIGERIYYFDRGSQYICVYDNANNRKCTTIVVSVNRNDFSDSLLGWKKGQRKIWLTCRDNLSGCVNDYVERFINDNGIYDLTISDYAGITTIKQFLIEKLDNTPPESLSIGVTNNSYKQRVGFSYKYRFKASDINKLKITADDSQSGIDKITYKWNSTCNNGLGLLGTEIINNETINYTISGTHTLFLCAKDKVGNIAEISKQITIYPGDLDESKTTISVNSSGDKYANNNDSYLYKLVLKDKYSNIITNKSINISNLNLQIDSLDKTLTTDEVNNTGENTLSIFDLDNSNISNGEISFKIKSLSPGEFTQKFKIKLNNWGENYINNTLYTEIIKKINSDNFFKKPISGELKILSGSNKPEIGKKQNYQIKLSNSGNLLNYTNGNLNISESTIENKIIGHIWNYFGDVSNYFGDNINFYLGFTGSIDVNDNILKGSEVGTNKLEISYNLGGKSIKYYLNDFLLNGCNVSTLGAKIIGTLQGDGKSNITGQLSNFSDLSKGELRSKIRKNAYILIKNRDSNTIINKIKYIEGDITISGDQSYETLIVKNGNVIISGNLNPSGKKLGIIVLKDNYVSESDYNKQGNIYIDKGVSKINSIIYADGTFRSANSNGVSYNDSELNNKLELNGSLFTRNTIGGAILGGSSFTLPGGQKITDFDLAEKYDLNYIRKVDSSCNINDDYSFLIKYDSKIQIDPPIGFK